MLHSYKSKDISTCLSRRNVVFIGDSVTRQLFFTTIHIADPNLSNRPPNNDEKHSDHEYTSQAAGTNIRFTFIWDPFLNTTRTRAILDGTSASESVKKPALLVLGSGLWYLRYADLSGGITAWEAMVYSTFEILSKRAREIADEVVFLPIEEIVREKLSTERAKSMHMADIDAMNTDLLHRLYGESSSKYSFLPDIVSSYGPSGESLIPISIPFAFNKMLSPNQTKDGLHFSETVLSVQANVLFNLRCNEVMPKVFPFAKTCCNRYPRPYFLQLVVLVFLVLSAPLAWAVTLRAGELF